MATIWFLSLIFLISILLAIFKHKKGQKNQQPPSPPRLPIIGNLHQLGKLPHQSLCSLSKKYGPVMLLKLGTVPTIVISSYEVARQALKVNDLNCCSRPNLAGSKELSYNYLDIVFSPFDDYWKEVKKLAVQELLSVKQIHSIQPIKEGEVKKLIDSLAESASQNNPVNLSKKFLDVTVSVVCRAAFGVSVQETVLNNDRFSKLVRESFEFLGSFSASDFFPNGGWIVDKLTGLQSRRERSVRDLDAFYEQMIDMHQQEKEQGNEDFVDLLLKLKKEEAVLGYGKLTTNHIKAILMNVLLGGIDTTAITMIWAMAELMRNPRVMKKVQSEIRNQMGNRTMITLDDTAQLHYLKMVIKETWRLHPPAPLLVPREVMSEFEINGYKIQPKTQLYVNVWAIGRDPDTWKDPEVFLPERFMDSDIDAKGQNFELLPFGSGRRICPGMYMGTTMVEFGLVNMLYQFDWKLPEGMAVEDIKMEEAPGLTVNMKNDLLLVPVKSKRRDILEMANVWLLSLLFLICILLAAFNHKKRRKYQQPPSPPSFPIIGNLHQLGELPHQSLWTLSKKYGPVMLLKLGTVPTVIVSSSDTARQALKVYDLHCCSRPGLAGPRELSYNYLDIAFSPYDDYWKEVRKLAVQELFSTKQVHLIQPIKDEEVKKLIDSIALSATQKTSVNLNKTFLALTVSVVCRASFGVSFEGTVLSNDKFNKLVREALEMLGSFSASDFIPYVGWIIDWFTGLQARREKSARDLDAFYEQMIDLHSKQEKEKGSEDFVDLLLTLEKEEAVLGNDKLTRNHIKAILMNVLLAGIDTSAITMTWAMTELARNPRVMKKVQYEIRNQMGNRKKISLDDIDHFKYLKMVIKETWRLHPTTPILLPREVMSEFEINGYTIPVKTRLHVNVWAIGRDPDTWKDPEVFLPERFIDSDIDAKGQNFELLPFGGGRRMCPAVYMGTTMVEFGLANMLYHFDWKLPEGIEIEDIDIEEAPGLTVNKKNELLLVPEKYLAH
ncbi:hypothetical protein AALP_AA5G029900 [Arabis alpina]|uniref:Cytochrome p450 n=1 Tax=Arabis alpina TaxID=50452 RepID=A0A087GUL2_ARAAL|nr:hypothetical protein AALP_AA5G029900 [Arabis alpina]